MKCEGNLDGNHIELVAVAANGSISFQWQHRGRTLSEVDMNIPVLTPAERFLIQEIKKQSDDYILAFDVAHLGFAGLCLILGLWFENGPAIITGAAMVLIFRVWERATQNRFYPVLRSMIAKLEQFTASQGDESAGMVRMQTESPYELPRLRFSIRALLGVMLLVGVFCAGWAAGDIQRRIRTSSDLGFPYEVMPTCHSRSEELLAPFPTLSVTDREDSYRRPSTSRS